MFERISGASDIDWLRWCKTSNGLGEFRSREVSSCATTAQMIVESKEELACREVRERALFVEDERR